MKNQWQFAAENPKTLVIQWQNMPSKWLSLRCPRQGLRTLQSKVRPTNRLIASLISAALYYVSIYVYSDNGNASCVWWQRVQCDTVQTRQHDTAWGRASLASSLCRSETTEPLTRRAQSRQRSGHTDPHLHTTVDFPREYAHNVRHNVDHLAETALWDVRLENNRNSRLSIQKLIQSVQYRRHIFKNLVLCPRISGSFRLWKFGNHFSEISNFS